MTLSIYDACVPPAQQTLGALRGVLAKAAQAPDSEALLQARLAPDMFPLVRQVQIVSDFARGAGFRLAGAEVPGFADTETTFAELDGRLSRTLDALDGLDPADFAGAEDRPVTIKVGGNPVTLPGKSYLLHFAMPNLYFHASAAYAILRHHGVVLGKRDFMGVVPGWPA